MREILNKDMNREYDNKDDITRDIIKIGLINIIIRFMPCRKQIALDEETDIVSELEYDSIALVELLNEIEERFGVDFIDLPDFAERFKKIGNIVDGIVLLKVKE